MQSIPTLLQLLECDWADTARLLRSELRSIAGDDAATMLESLGVISPATPSNQVDGSCDFCASHDVVQNGDGDDAEFYEVCPYGEGGPIDAAELQTWAVDPVGIANVLASAVEAGHVAEPLLPNAAWRIGDVSIGGEPFSVVFATRRGASQLADRREASRMIAIGHRLPADAFAGTLTLAEAFAFTSDSVELRPNRLRQAIPLSTERPGNAFYRKGQVWVVRFNGEETFLENNVGPLYIARLLATPHQPVPAITLLASRIGIDEQKLIGSSGELADQQSVDECRQRYRELMLEIEEARSNNDLGNLERLQVEEDALTTHFASVLGKGGKRREVGDVIKISKSVSMAIRRTIDVLETELKPLADHLNDAVTRGVAPIYSPRCEPDWLV